MTAWATVLSFASVVLSDNVVSLYHNLKFIDVIFFLKNKRKKIVYSYKVAYQTNFWEEINSHMFISIFIPLKMIFL